MRRWVRGGKASGALYPMPETPHVAPDDLPFRRVLIREIRYTAD
jgi:hypothetical protein